jgi:peptide deformylase
VALLGIRVLGDPILREPTRRVAQITDELRQLMDDMFETMHAAEGIGLAAPQIGRSERVAVIDVGDGPIVLVNPEILAREGKARDSEGCLSIPDISGDVDRATTVVLRALDRHGVPFELEAHDLLARCIQHEVDHLDGKLFIDYLSLLKRRAAARQWEREVQKYPGFVRTVEPRKPGRRGRARAQLSEQPPEQSPTHNSEL